ncbi:GNAT family N-acetyltransferase [Rubrobacter tropicus]|uniref:GNAT family N-acetyltransferase n=1 Tax=Rubrobacter tropicus TaxID=2653851 RepID=A0A6G8Q471_9ACTN|nr:GNAT family N-acetyltransferase [Rubrobacter tropicus]QIN81248.1 GNAT family N-acetyltransferase [Rubrobacter tropicus]
MSSAVLPEFMHHDAAVNRCWGRLFADFAGFQVAVCDDDDHVVAAGNSIPFVWNGRLYGLPGGVGETVGRGVGDLEAGRGPTVASTLLAMVTPGHQGRGLSAVVLRAMKEEAAGRGLAAMIAPVRPTLKDRYPLTPMERYARWKRDDGLPFDPWLRVHRRLGAEILRVAPRAMRISGTVGEWEAWTGMRFPESGPYVVPGALCPVRMDLELDLGTYEEPNVWMRHPIGTKR